MKALKFRISLASGLRKSAIALNLTSTRSYLHQLYYVSISLTNSEGVENEIESVRIPGHHNVVPSPLSHSLNSLVLSSNLPVPSWRPLRLKVSSCFFSNVPAKGESQL